MLWIHFDASAMSEKKSLPKSGIRAIRPNRTIRPVSPSNMKEPASSQWLNRSIAVNRKIMRPVFSPSMRIGPRTAR